jgi:hypothetical protein
MESASMGIDSQTETVRVQDTRMRDLFKGWRRKMAYVTLVIAVVMCIAWTRSTALDETIHVSVGHSSVSLHSLQGYMTWSYERLEVARSPRFSFNGYPSLYPLPSPRLLEFAPRRKTYNGQIWWEWTLHYCLFTAPSIVICAWLFLGKPRRTKGVETPPGKGQCQ